MNDHHGSSTCFHECPSSLIFLWLSTSRPSTRSATATDGLLVLADLYVAGRTSRDLLTRRLPSAGSVSSSGSGSRATSCVRCSARSHSPSTGTHRTSAVPIHAVPSRTTPRAARRLVVHRPQGGSRNRGLLRRRLRAPIGSVELPGATGPAPRRRLLRGRVPPRPRRLRTAHPTGGPEPESTPPNVEADRPLDTRGQPGVLRRPQALDLTPRLSRPVAAGSTRVWDVRRRPDGAP